MKDSGSAINLVSASTDDAEKVFQEAIEQVTKNIHLLSLPEHTQLLLIKGGCRLFLEQNVTGDILISVLNTLFFHIFLMFLILFGSRFQGMTGKGWTWIGTDGATTSTFVNSPNLKRAMQGMVGTRPKNGEGALYQKLLKTWKEKDASLYPGLIHSPRVLQVCFSTLSLLFLLLLLVFQALCCLGLC